MSTMEQAKSADGTSLAFWREGTGAPLLLVHGGICDHLAWHYVVPLLAKKFTVYAYDRRGRGRSGDTVPHAVEREVEDIEALLSVMGEPAYLLGHSAGAILSLASAVRSEPLRGLILYEPPFIVGNARPRPGPEVLKQIEGHLAAGEQDEALRIAMRESVGMAESEIDQMQAGPGWEHLREVAQAIPYDWKLWDEELNPERLRNLQAPVLLMLGSASPPWIRVSTEAVLAAAPKVSLAILQGQEHFAMITAPELFAREVIRFAESIG